MRTAKNTAIFVALAIGGAGCASGPTMIASFETVGELSDGFESDLIGASAFQMLEGGDIVVLDRANGRLVLRSPGEADVFVPLADVFGREIDAQDFRLAGRTLFVVTAEGVLTAPAPAALAPPSDVELESAEVAVGEAAILTLRRGGRPLRPQDATIALESSSDEICDSDDWRTLSSAAWTDQQISRDGRRLAARFRRASETVLNISFEDDTGEAFAATPISGAATVAGASFVALDSRAYILVEFIEQARGALRVSAAVYRYLREADAFRADARYDVPIAQYRSLPSRYVEVSNGRVSLYGRRNGEDRKSVVELEPIALDAGDRAPRPRPAETSGAARAGGSPAVRSDVRLESAGSDSTMRTEIIERAQEFTDMTWTLGESEYGPPADMASRCSPSEGARWKRPGRLSGRIGETITAMPYRWGGWDTRDEFLEDTTRVAGNTCTCRNADCVVAGTKGADCSGFVTLAWAAPVTSKLGTTSIPSWSTAKDWRDLKCGDVLNLSGHHVRLFARFIPDYGGRIEFYESSLDCGGVCLRSAPTALFHGYSPREYKNLED